MLKNLRKNNKGFTIIEVLIVLAIAGLIMLVVFLAVPALQRNSRNTSRKTDVASILGAMSEYTNNNNGSFPAACAAGAAGCNAANTWLQNAKLSAIDSNLVSFTVAPAAAPAAPAALDTVALYSKVKCLNATTATIANATSRSLVAMYLVEAGGNPIAQCVESGS